MTNIYFSVWEAGKSKMKALVEASASADLAVDVSCCIFIKQRAERGEANSLEPLLKRA